MTWTTWIAYRLEDGRAVFVAESVKGVETWGNVLKWLVLGEKSTPDPSRKRRSGAWHPRMEPRMHDNSTRLIQRSYKTELAPSKTQAQALRRHMGAVRFIYNWGLTRKQETYKATGKSPGAYALCKELTQLKRTDCPWLYEVNNRALQNALRNLDRAFKNFYQRLEQGKKPGFPGYKRKRDGGSFRVDAHVVIEDDRVRLPNIGWVRLKERGYLPVGDSHTVSVTVSLRADRWFVSVQMEERMPTTEVEGPVVGVDLGCARLATLSDGEIIENPRAYRQAERKLKRLGRTLSRKKAGSANRRKARIRIARAHMHVANVRKHAIHRTTTAIAKRCSVVVIEDLNVQGLGRNRTMAKSISDAGMSEFRRQLAYKCDWYGSVLVVANRFFPSSKMCSCCGSVLDAIPLGQRIFSCASCGFTCDRDLNAALNLRNVAVKSTETQNACGEYVRPEVAQAVVDEAGTRDCGGLGGRSSRRGCAVQGSPGTASTSESMCSESIPR